MRQQTITVRNRLGLHARVAAKIVRVSNQFKSDVRLQRLDNGRAGDAKSIFGILLLAATQGTQLILTTSGEDEAEALKELANFIERQFDDTDA
ncbi:MAG: HPr family phosphocarrier protein [Acidobacteriota bacterium]|nr:HPr family phosphocarrier protein [Blastocatellia bacterium]MDW8238512.1 HPr family phosphocarrier protein [Acidobacteriota bacterium]